MFRAPAPTGGRLAAGALRLLAPCEPSKIVGLWNNFHALAAKLGKTAPEHPLFFLKPGTSVIGTRQAIERPAQYAGKILFEGELGIVIGRRCRDVALADSGACIFGYT